MSNDLSLWDGLYIGLNFLASIAIPLIIRFGVLKRPSRTAYAIGISLLNTGLVIFVAKAYGGRIAPLGAVITLLFSYFVLVHQVSEKTKALKSEYEAEKAEYRAKKEERKAEKGNGIIEILKSIGLFVVGFPIGIFIFVMVLVMLDTPEPQGASIAIAGIVGGMSMVFLVGAIKGYRQKKPKAEKAEKKEQKKSGQSETGWPSPEEQSPNASQKKEGSRWKGRVVALLILFVPLIAILLYGLMQTQV